MPLVSVFIPVYNREKYIKKSIQSILNQSLTDFELIIINDGSTDNTEEIILSFDSPKIRYYKNKQNLGIPKTRNRGLELARGKYLALLDSDDVALPNRLKIQVDYMESHPEVIVSGTHFKNIKILKRYEHSIKKTDSEIRSFLLWGVPFLQPTLIIRLNEIKNKKIKYSEECDVAEDYDFAYKIVNEAKGKITNLKHKTIFYRRHSENITVTRPIDDFIRSGRNVRKFLLKSLFEDEYEEKYPDYIEAFCTRDFSCFRKIFQAFDFLFLLIKKNNLKKAFPVYAFNNNIKDLCMSIIYSLILSEIIKLLKFNYDFKMKKQIIILTFKTILIEKKFLKKIGTVLKFLLCFSCFCILQLLLFFKNRSWIFYNNLLTRN